MVGPAALLAAELDATLVNMRFVKPLDTARSSTSRAGTTPS